MDDAVEEAIANAKAYAIGGSDVMPHAPRLGGSDADG